MRCKYGECEKVFYIIIITILVAIDISLISEVQQLRSELHFLHQAIQYRYDYLIKEIRKVQENDGSV